MLSMLDAHKQRLHLAIYHFVYLCCTIILYTQQGESVDFQSQLTT